MKTIILATTATLTVLGSAREIDLNFETDASIVSNSIFTEDGKEWHGAIENTSSSNRWFQSGGARKGSRSLRINSPNQSGSGVYRSEIWLRNHDRWMPAYSDRLAITEGTDKHMGFSIKINSGSGTLRSWCAVKQLQQWGGLPAGAVYLGNSATQGRKKLTFTARWGTSATSSDRRQRDFVVDGLLEDRWYDVVIHFRESNSRHDQQRKWGDGTYRFWLYDSVTGSRLKYGEHKGQWCYYETQGQPAGVTARVGVYKAKNNPVVDVSYDNVRMDRWWSSVFPGNN